MQTPLRYCPHCATPLALQPQGGRERLACPQGHWVHWDNPLPVVAAVIELGGQVLLARNAAWPPKMFGLVTGFLERDETPEQAVLREVAEETGLRAEAAQLIGVYEFMRRNELIIAYAVQAHGPLQLSEELAEVKLLPPHKLRPWRLGTGYALADWLRARGHPVEWLESPLE
ncbi:MAG: NUDIX hydrolase [Betaproteobacteria bacterium]|nr:NUDIX hydrolase [Betaproteobacteria bacterium]MDE2047315.1 NUDIX hydrolase [Betaproteobacteria bacterium]